MLLLALRSLRFRKGNFLATFIAMLFGAAIVTASGGLLETGVRDNVPSQRLAGAPIVVTGNPSYPLIRGDESVLLPERVRLDHTALHAIQNVPGVARAVADVSFPVQVRGTTVPGRDWGTAFLAPYALRAGNPPTGPGEVVLNRSLAARSGISVGDHIQVAIRGKRVDVRVSGIATAASVHTQQSMFFSAADVARYFPHSGAVDSVAVLPAAGQSVQVLRDRISHAVPDAAVLAGSDRGLAEFPDARSGKSTLVVMAGVFGGLATAVAIFVISSTLALTVQHRLRELALLRTAGITPRQLRRMIVAEAAVIAALAAAVGILPGRYLGRWLFEQLGSHDVVPDVLTFYQGWIPVAAGCGVGLLSALVAAIVAGRRAGRVRPIQALSESADEGRWLGPIRLVLALLFLGGGFALLLVTMTVMSGPAAASTAGPSIMLWAIGFALLGPLVTRLAGLIVGLPVRLFTGRAGRLAVLNFRARTVPMAAAVVPVMLATALATANLYMQTTQNHADEHAYLKDLHADAVLTSATGAFEPGLLQRVRAVPGVAAASPYVTSIGAIDSPHDPAQDEDGLPLRGVDGAVAAQVTGIRADAGELADLRGDTVAIPQRRAHRLGLHPGDRMTVRLGDRTAHRLRVVALFPTARGYDSLLLPADLLAAHTTSGAATQILVRAEPGASGKVTGQLHRMVSGAPGVAVSDRDALIASDRDSQRIGNWINYLLVGMIVAYTAVSIVNTLVAATMRRRREFGLQRLAGSTRWQVLRMSGVEGVLIAVVGVGLGAAVALLTLLPFCAALGDTSWPHGPLWIFGAISGTAFLLTMIATLVPAWVALRSRPVEAVAAV